MLNGMFAGQNGFRKRLTIYVARRAALIDGDANALSITLKALLAVTAGIGFGREFIELGTAYC